MELDPQERDSDMGDDSPVSPNDEEISDIDGESGREPEDDSCDELRRHGGGIIADHGDVLAKLKMQVRDIKVGEDFENAARHMSFPLTSRSLQDNFHLPAPFPFPHPTTPFMPPLLPPPPATSSGSSHSSEGSASSQHTWSFEEQFKQVRQLYEINDDPKRKEFLDELFSFMQKRGTPINRLPIMAKSVLDLYELYNLVIARGGLVDVINKKLWQEIIKGLHLPSSITSAAFTLRTQYMKYLYPFENDKLRLSTPLDLQAAIDGNRREGRRSSYGQYDAVRSPNSSQMSPLSLVSQQQQLAARMNSVMSASMGLHNGVHHPSHPQPLGQQLNGGPLPGLAPNEFEARMMEYVKLLNKGISDSAAALPRPGNISSPPNATSPLNPLELSRMTLWNMYNNNQAPVEPQKEALNLSESTQPSIKRESEHRETGASPPKKFAKDHEEHKCVSSATQIKINSKGEQRNGKSSLSVTMEINGTMYEGVLFAQPASPDGRTAIAS